MVDSRPNHEWRLVAILSLAAWLLKAGFIVALPLRALAMTPWLIDDSFIIAATARNLAAGHGLSFDGVDPTSGVPLLWTLATSLNHLLLDREWAMKAAILESSLCGAMASTALWALARRLLGRAAAWGAFFFSLLGAPLVFNTLNGMETAAFSLLALAAFFGLAPHGARSATGREIQDSPTACGLRAHGIAGALLGLATMMRAEAVFLILALGAVALRRPGRNGRVARTMTLMAGAAPFVFAACAWSWVADGSLAPVNQAGRRFLWWDARTGADGTISFGVLRDAYLTNIRDLWGLADILLGSASIMLPLAGFALWRHRGNPVVRAFALYISVFLPLLTFYQGYFPDAHGLRYLHFPALGLAALAFDSAGRLAGKWAIHGTRRAVALAAMIVALAAGSALRYHTMTQSLSWTLGMEVLPFYPENTIKEWWKFLDWAGENLPVGARLAAKDHGRLAYFTGVSIIDLAGITDPGLVPAARQGVATQYLREKGMAFVLLPKAGGIRVQREIREEMNLVPAPGAPPQEATGCRLYRVRN